MKKTGFIAIVGRPNVGKSTLLNSILGEKVAIVSAKPQTTRNRITGIHTVDENQYVFLDTPGMHKPRTKLGDFIKSGIEVDSVVSPFVLRNIFFNKAPLHDGAAIIGENRIKAGACFLPLTQNNDFSKELGTRHRAGIGITEHSDALVLIVSEESGIISIAEDGQLTRYLDLKTVEKTLLNMFLNPENMTATMSTVHRMIDKVRRGKHVQ